MPKLILSGLCKGLYNEKTACAYVSYGTIDQPADHTNKLLSDFSVEFNDHLLTVVIPMFNKHLKNSAYFAKDLDFLNNASFPVITLFRNDSQNMQESDIKEIKKLIQTMLIAHNDLTAKSIKSLSMFSKNADSKTSHKDAKHTHKKREFSNK
jgi:hypothetical protein